MRTHHTLLLALAGMVLGCGRSNESQPSVAHIEADMTGAHGEHAALSEPSPPEAALTSSVATYTDTARRFVLTGDLRFRTHDVVKTSFAIEDLVAQQGGFVASTQLSTQVGHTYITPISADSSLETTKYTVINRMTVRVPGDRLDGTLRSLIAFVDFLDHRTLAATDVRIAILRDKLTRQRLARHAARVSNAIDEKSGKLKETVGAEDRLIDRQEQADEAALNTVELEDKIAFSTITLDIYQRERIRRVMLANESNVEAYEPGFFSKAGEAMQAGWELLKDFTLFLIRSWSIILMLVVVYLLYRRLVRRVK